MSEPVMLWMAVPVGMVILTVADYIAGVVRCKTCKARLNVVDRAGRTVGQCPNGCGAPR